MTRRTACVTILSASACLALADSMAFRTFGLVPGPSYNSSNTTEEYCDVTQGSLYPIIAWLDLILYSLLPSLIIASTNIAIVLTLRRSGQPAAASSIQSGTSIAQRSRHRIVPMLLLVSTVFVVSSLVSSVYFLGKGESGTQRKTGWLGFSALNWQCQLIQLVSLFIRFQNRVCCKSRWTDQCLPATKSSRLYRISLQNLKAS